MAPKLTEPQGRVLRFLLYAGHGNVAHIAEALHGRSRGRARFVGSTRAVVDRLRDLGLVRARPGGYSFELTVDGVSVALAEKEKADRR